VHKRRNEDMKDNLVMMLAYEINFMAIKRENNKN
jgi:hypothetical protein